MKEDQISIKDLALNEHETEFLGLTQKVNKLSGKLKESL